MTMSATPPAARTTSLNVQSEEVIRGLYQRHRPVEFCSS